MRKKFSGFEEELEVTHTKGSGPGGQNRNKRMTGVRVRHLPTGITVLATERRSQAQNLSAALERLSEKIESFFHKDLPRHATKPTRGSKVEKKKAKQGRSKIKKMRQRPGDSDW